MESGDAQSDKIEQEKRSIFSGLADDEDESHLPPGVRRQNRCHSSSSEDEEDEGKKKPGSASDSSDSDSEKETKKNYARIGDSEAKSKSPEGKSDKVEESKPKEDQSDATRKEKDSSRSRSRSGSPSHGHRKRRSSERSRGSRSRSRSPDRRHKKDRRRRSHRSKSRDRKRDRDHHRRRKDHRRSRSRSREPRDRRRGDRDRRDRDRRGGRRDRSRSRDRSRRNRSRSNSPQSSKIIKFGDKVIKPGASFGRPVSSNKPLTFKEKMRQQFIKAMEEGADVSTALTATDGTVLCTQTAGTQQTQLIPAPKKPPVPLMATMVTSTAGLLATPTITASEAAMQSMLQLQKETTAKTGVEIPSYYNPGAINPVKYAEQVQKRKLLWSKNKEKDVNTQWNTTSLSGEHDDKSKEKFRKLMGIKQDSGEGDHGTQDQEQEMKQRQIFDQLDKEYQFARMATHTHRGIGLGFGSANFHPPTSTALSPPTTQMPPTTTAS